jgi:SAM-dependent methyltransferase
LVDFNETRHRYRQTVEDSIALSGQGLEFFTKVKAECLRRAAQEFLPSRPAPQLLDVGCGHGFIHPYLRGYGMEVTGVEIAAEVLDLAREANPGVTYAAYDGKTLPFDAASFDIVLAVCVMHHVPPAAWTALLAEMRRVVRPGGLVLIFEHNPFNPLTRYIVAHNDLDAEAVLLSSRTLKARAAAAGLRALATRYTLFTPFGHAIFRWLDDRLGWLPLGAQYFLVARPLAARS